jgi:hypothetical protein
MSQLKKGYIKFIENEKTVVIEYDNDRDRIVRSDREVDGMAISLEDALGGSDIGSGTPNFATKWNTNGDGLVNSQIYDNGIFIGIGTIDPQAELHIRKSGLSRIFLESINTQSQIDLLGTQCLLNMKALNGDSIFEIDGLINSTFTLKSNSIVKYILNSTDNDVREYMSHSFITFVSDIHRIVKGDNTTEILYINGISSRVGIGTGPNSSVINPLAKLHIVGEGNTNSTSAFKIDNSTNNSLMFVRNDGVVNFGQDVIVTGFSGSNLLDWYGALLRSKENMVIQDGSGYYSALFLSNTTTTDQITWYIGASGNLGYNTDGFVIGNSTNNIPLRINKNNQVRVGGFVNDESISAQFHVIGLDDTSSNFALKVENISEIPLLYVRNDSRIGIGESNPSSFFHIKPNIKVDNYYTPFIKVDRYFDNGQGSIEDQSNCFIVNWRGYVGIGTDSPQTDLHLYGLNPTIFLDGDSNSAYTSLLLSNAQSVEIAQLYGGRSRNEIGTYTNAGSNLLGFNLLSYGGFSFLVNNTSSPRIEKIAMLITEDARVGINTSFSDIQLNSSVFTIKGSDATSSNFALKVENSVGSNLLSVTNDGKVRIPAFLLVGSPNHTTSAVTHIKGYTASWGNDLSQSNPVFIVSNQIDIELFRCLDNGFVKTLGLVIGNANHVSSQVHIKGSTWNSGADILIVDNAIDVPMFKIQDNGVIVMANLPTSSVGLPSGALWRNGTVVNIVD